MSYCCELKFYDESYKKIGERNDRKIVFVVIKILQFSSHNILTYLKLGNRDLSSKKWFSFPNDPDRQVEPSLDSKSSGIEYNLVNEIITITNKFDLNRMKLV